MMTCWNGFQCPSEHCTSSRMVIHHWTRCTNAECPICGAHRTAQNMNALSTIPIVKDPEPRPPGTSQPWHSEVPKTDREAVIERISKHIMLHPQRFEPIWKIKEDARAAELQIFEAAGSRDEYYRMVEERAPREQDKAPEGPGQEAQKEEKGAGEEDPDEVFDHMEGTSKDFQGSTD